VPQARTLGDPEQILLLPPLLDKSLAEKNVALEHALHHTDALQFASLQSSLVKP
jgi:hypothetical protein